MICKGEREELILSKSCLSDAEKQAVMGVLDREYLGIVDCSDLSSLPLLGPI